MEWFNIKNPNSYNTEINNYEKKINSQNGEDGVIEEIFKNIKYTNRKCVEFGFHYDQANTLKLMKENWNNLFLDIDNKNAINFNQLYKNKYPNSKAGCEQITINNINDILKKYGYDGEIDFLSIDIDSNDYYIWEAITISNPRVICIEYNASLGPDISVTQPINAVRGDQTQDYWGSSYKALVNLAHKKGYNLVASVSGLNLFFVRKDISLNNLKIVQNAWQPPFNSTYKTENNKIMPKYENRLKDQYEKIINKKWNIIE